MADLHDEMTEASEAAQLLADDAAEEAAQRATALELAGRRPATVTRLRVERDRAVEASGAAEAAFESWLHSQSFESAKAVINAADVSELAVERIERLIADSA